MHIAHRQTVGLQWVNFNVINTRLYSAAFAGGRLSRLHEYDKRADRKWQPIFVR